MSSELGERLRRERLRRHERQEDTAARFGISQPSYWRWEAGKGLPRDEYFARIADFLGLTTEEIWQLAYGGEQPRSLSDLTEQVAALRRDVEDLRALLEAQTVDAGQGGAKAKVISARSRPLRARQNR